MRNPILRAIAMLALILSLAAPAVGGAFDEAGRAYENMAYAVALELYRSAADQGDAQSQYVVGVMHRAGHGVTPDDAEAARWFTKAAGQGHVRAQNHLGFMYEEGLGVPRDHVQAHKWYRLSAAVVTASDKAATYLRDRVSKSLSRVADKMTPVQIAEAQKLAAEWKPVPHEATPTEAKDGE